MQVHQDLLDNGKVKKLNVALNSITTDNAEAAKTLRTETEYFRSYASACAIPSFAAFTYSSVLVSLKLDAKP